MILKNFTPHTINLVCGVDTLAIPSMGIARVTELKEKASALKYKLDKAPCCEFVNIKYGEVEGLPEPEDGVQLIVSSFVFNASDRDDLCYPSGFVRDEAGNIKAAACLVVR